MKQLALDNSWRYEYSMTAKDGITGEVEPVAGLTSLSCWLSATDQGATIDSALTKTLAEYSGKPGTYFALVDGPTLASKLSTYVGKTVWEVLVDGTNVKTSEPRRVVSPRRP